MIVDASLIMASGWLCIGKAVEVGFLQVTHFWGSGYPTLFRY